MSDEQIHTSVNGIVAILQEAEKGEKTLTDVCKEKGISENTFLCLTKEVRWHPNRRDQAAAGKRFAWEGGPILGHLHVMSFGLFSITRI